MIEGKARFLAALLLPLSVSAAAGNLPNNVPFGPVPEATARLFLKHEPWLFYGELYNSWETDSRIETDATVGTYYRLFDNLKVGAFYELASGLRHDEDW